MIEVDMEMLRIGDQHAAEGCSAACTGLLVAVARSRRRALAGDPYQRPAYSQEACGSEASRVGSAGEAGERLLALPEIRRH